MCDSSLTRTVDDQGRPWAICQICIEWVPYEKLAIDPTDGLRWDVCAECDAKEFNRLAGDLIRHLMPQIPGEYQPGFETMMAGGEYAMAIEDLVALVENHQIRLHPNDAQTLHALAAR